MRPNARFLALLTATLVASACSEPPPQADSDDTTRSLLAQPVGDGMSTPIVPGDGGASGAPQISVAEVGINRGSIEAPIKVVEMSDYGCGYCRKFHDETFPTLLADFIESGKVEWKFVPYITGMFENSLAATEAAECTYAQSPQAFETLNTRLWDEQAAWKGSATPDAVVRGWVTELGVDMAAFDSCLTSDDRLPRIAAATTLARQIGVRGTPTFVVIGWPPLQGALPTQTFVDLLSAAYAQVMAESGEPQ